MVGCEGCDDGDGGVERDELDWQVHLHQSVILLATGLLPIQWVSPRVKESQWAREAYVACSLTNSIIPLPPCSPLTLCVCNKKTMAILSPPLSKLRRSTLRVVVGALEGVKSTAETRRKSILLAGLPGVRAGRGSEISWVSWLDSLEY